MIPIDIRIKLDFSERDFGSSSFISVINQSFDYLLVDSKGLISGITEKIY